jgi:hypothetical protein
MKLVTLTPQQSPRGLCVGRWVGSLVFGAAALFTATHPAWAQTSAPTIRLFPTTVLEDIKATGTIAEEMETSLQDVITRLDQQQQLFAESKCDGADQDPGCTQIARQLGASYLEMLNIMGDKLPEMEQAVQGTHASLQKRLRTELGQKMTPWDLQETLLGKKADQSSDSAPVLRGRSGMRLSDRFRQYYQLVAHGGTAGQSLAVVASDIYLDMQEASELIAKTRGEINRAQLMEQLNQSFGSITPEMQQVVLGVKGILFGESDAEVPIASLPPSSPQESYRSPLEL